MEIKDDFSSKFSFKLIFDHISKVSTVPFYYFGCWNVWLRNRNCALILYVSASSESADLSKKFK